VTGGASGIGRAAARLLAERGAHVVVADLNEQGAQQVADELVNSGVKIIFNYSEALLDVPHDITVHTSNPAVDLLHALYFHLT
jgi:redox-sensing transcriptional repressor